MTDTSLREQIDQMIPPDPLPRCDECGKVKGDFKGWYGPQCMCGQIDYEAAAKRAHSISAGTRKADDE